jgi:hypothetical protein
MASRFALAAPAALLTALALAGCAATPDETVGPPAKEFIDAVSTSNQLVRFNAGQPQKLLSSRPLTGLAPGDTLVGVDYRVAKGQLFGLGTSGQLYRIDTRTAAASPVGTPNTLPREGATEWGVDFNPTVDRIRVVSNTGQNLRLHPDTGAVVDGNPNMEGVQTDAPLSFAAGDINAGKSPMAVGAAYSYNKADPKITTNYLLDAASGSLLTQGSREGTTPAVSPNTGQLFTVGKLGMSFDDTAFDIQALSDVAFAALNSKGTSATRWVTIDLKTGAAKALGTIGGGEVVTSIALEP